jgi:predicted alpha/beta-hydrolase family hydrolase
MKRVLKRWWLILLVLLFAGVSGFVIWGSTPLGPMPEALTALDSGPEVTVTTDRWLTFAPTEAATTGLILYPGGRVDPRAYAPTARAIAEEGVLVVIVPMPLNLAVLAPNRAQAVMDAHPEIDAWAIGGHSLGGAMAARFTDEYPERVDGLVLWASYPAEGNSLADQDSLAVVSIYATEDGLAILEEIEASRPLLPPQTTWVELVGGNHAQFGWYGPQDGDGTAEISRKTQQDLVSEATLELLRGL